ncbi:F-box and associated interaction domain protein [Medicago truncatula]|uniref:F-box and associated interaction domain protein n=2 Tax=Medicago truncatula TaxID=3880 RepID=G7JWT9_MEDTR|nr:F-box and associated interaction domain protein [Medicago truncatula]
MFSNDMHTAANIRKYLTIISTIISKIPLTKETGVTTKQPLHAAPLIYIPLDLLAEILCRLPVKVLQQIRCVCKSWNALISDDFVFAKKHLSMSKKRQHLITATWIKPTKLILMSYEIVIIFISLLVCFFIYLLLTAANANFSRFV